MVLGLLVLLTLPIILCGMGIMITTEHDRYEAKRYESPSLRIN